MVNGTLCKGYHASATVKTFGLVKPYFDHPVVCSNQHYWEKFVSSMFPSKFIKELL